VAGDADSRIAFEAALRRLACDYARAMDRNEPDRLRTVLTDDVILEGPGFRYQGLEAALAMPGILQQMFRGTRHLVHNQTAEVQGDAAEAETSCSASHLLPLREGTGEQQVLVWEIRYLDTLRRERDGWRICHRKVVRDWTETRTVEVPA